MVLEFHKYQGTGNDFIVFDNRDRRLAFEEAEIVRLCDRKFGIGSDGLILIEPSVSADFTMVFYNPDGSKSFCGNGSRCAVHFAQQLGIVNHSCVFEAIDGLHKATIAGNQVSIAMKPVASLERLNDSSFFVHTGSPHVVQFVPHVADEDVVQNGRRIRFSELFAPNGTNVNFVEKTSDSSIFVRTYERGVENETLSCGTGVTACALAFSQYSSEQHPASLMSEVKVDTPGGALEVSWKKTKDGGFEHVELSGPAVHVFSGKINR